MPTTKSKNQTAKRKRSMLRLKYLVTLSFFLIVILWQCTPAEKPATEKPTISLSEPGPGGYVDPPSVRSYPTTAGRINGWIANLEVDSIRMHAWDMWESITTTTNSGLPVWETWYTGHELFEMGSRDSETEEVFRDFGFPTQFVHASVQTSPPIDVAERPTSFNRYTQSVADFIWDQGYNEKSVLDAINDSFNTNHTAIVDRQIQTSKDTIDALSIVLKPVFQFIEGDQPTALPYWAGVSVATTTNLTNPEPYTWRQCVVVDPTGTLVPGSLYPMSCNGAPAQYWPVVALEDFYSILITQAQADSFSKFAETSGDDIGKGNKGDSASVADLVKEGNYALLMAMHVTGKEINKWTWQTFWWSHYPQNAVFGKDRPSAIGGPWDNYNMRTAYYMVAPANTEHGGEPLISYNPYLETNLSGTVAMENIADSSIAWFGVFSNCMSCHRMAAYPNSNYVPNGYIDPADSFKFSANTKTDFLWSIPTRAQ